ncbi:MAG: hypothetical protein P8J20_13705 [Novosphingobium sp.]|nr:hypothetical protein [Novosphingobium sp.]
MKRHSSATKALSALALIGSMAFATTAQADTFSRTANNPHFTVNTPGATITMTWFAPVPASVEISRYSGDYNSNPASTVVYDGPPPPSISLTGGGRTGGGRYTIKAKNAAGVSVPFTVTVVGPSTVKNW